MAEDKIKFSEAEILVHSQTLNTASQSLTDTCKNMYDVITKMQENEAFKSKLASGEYYAKIDRLNGQVPKFTEGVLKFSKFLSGYLVENYNETDELAKQIQETFNDSLEQLTAVAILGGATVDITKISATAQGAISREGWIDSDKINKEAFADTGSLDFVTRDDGSIMITRDGVPIGFTTEEGLKPNESAATSMADEKIISQADYNHLPEAQRKIVDGEGYKVVADSEYQKMASASNVNQGSGQNRADYYDGRVSSSIADEKIISQADYNHLPEAQRKIVDGEGYKVVSDSEFAKMSQGGGQIKAGSYDGSASSNATNEDFMNNQMTRNNPDVAKASKLASNTEGMGNNEAIIKARENETLSPKESSTGISSEKIISQKAYDNIPDEHKNNVDRYKVVSDSEYAKMSQGTGQNRADSYDARVSSTNTTTNTAEFDSNVFYNQNITSTNNQNPDAGSIIEAAFKLDNQKKDASSIAETAFKLDS